MTVRAMLLILGLFHLANGVFMLAAPEAWYAAVPGVAMTGPVNQHFVADIGLAFVASGAGLILGAANRPWAVWAAMAGATWPALHALLHLWGWLSMGIPTARSVILSEVLGVFALGCLGVGLAWLRARQKGAA